MQNVLIDKGIILPSGEINKDKINLVAGEVTLVERYDKAKDRLNEVMEASGQRNAKRIELERFIRILGKRDSLLTGFDEELWYAVVDRLVVKPAAEVTVVFKDGSGVGWKIK